MVIGGEPRPTENIIGDRVFGITLLSIQETLDKLKKELQEANSALELPYVDFSKQFPSEAMAKQTLDIFNHIKLRDEAILAVSPEEILQSLQDIYNFITGLEKRGLSEKSILSKIEKERSDLSELIRKFTYMLEDKDWGTNLNHGLLHI